MASAKEGNVKLDENYCCLSGPSALIQVQPGARLTLQKDTGDCKNAFTVRNIYKKKISFIAVISCPLHLALTPATGELDPTKLVEIHVNIDDPDLPSDSQVTLHALVESPDELDPHHLQEIILPVQYKSGEEPLKTEKIENKPIQPDPNGLNYTCDASDNDRTSLGLSDVFQDDKTAQAVSVPVTDGEECLTPAWTSDSRDTDKLEAQWNPIPRATISCKQACENVSKASATEDDVLQHDSTCEDIPRNTDGHKTGRQGDSQTSHQKTSSHNAPCDIQPDDQRTSGHNAPCEIQPADHKIPSYNAPCDIQIDDQKTSSYNAPCDIQPADQKTSGHNPPCDIQPDDKKTSSHNAPCDIQPAEKSLDRVAFNHDIRNSNSNATCQLDEENLCNSNDSSPRYRRPSPDSLTSHAHCSKRRSSSSMSSTSIVNYNEENEIHQNLRDGTTSTLDLGNMDGRSVSKSLNFVVDDELTSVADYLSILNSGQFTWVFKVRGIPEQAFTFPTPHGLLHPGTTTEIPVYFTAAYANLLELPQVEIKAAQVPSTQSLETITNDYLEEIPYLEDTDMQQIRLSCNVRYLNRHEGRRKTLVHLPGTDEGEMAGLTWAEDEDLGRFGTDRTSSFDLEPCGSGRRYRESLTDPREPLAPSKPASVFSDVTTRSWPAVEGERRKQAPGNVTSVSFDLGASRIELPNNTNVWPSESFLDLPQALHDVDHGLEYRDNQSLTSVLTFTDDSAMAKKFNFQHIWDRVPSNEHGSPLIVVSPRDVLIFDLEHKNSDKLHVAQLTLSSQHNKNLIFQVLALPRGHYELYPEYGQLRPCGEAVISVFLRGGFYSISKDFIEARVLEAETLMRPQTGRNMVFQRYRLLCGTDEPLPENMNLSSSLPQECRSLVRQQTKYSLDEPSIQSLPLRYQGKCQDRQGLGPRAPLQDLQSVGQMSGNTTQPVWQHLERTKPPPPRTISYSVEPGQKRMTNVQHMRPQGGLTDEKRLHVGLTDEAWSTTVVRGNSPLQQASDCSLSTELSEVCPNDASFSFFPADPPKHTAPHVHLPTSDRYDKTAPDRPMQPTPQRLTVCPRPSPAQKSPSLIEHVYIYNKSPQEVKYQVDVTENIHIDQPEGVIAPAGMAQVTMTPSASFICDHQGAMRIQAIQVDPNLAENDFETLWDNAPRSKKLERELAYEQTDERALTGLSDNQPCFQSKESMLFDNQLCSPDAISFLDLAQPLNSFDPSLRQEMQKKLSYDQSFDLLAHEEFIDIGIFYGPVKKHYERDVDIYQNTSPPVLPPGGYPFSAKQPPDPSYEASVTSTEGSGPVFLYICPEQHLVFDPYQRSDAPEYIYLFNVSQSKVVFKVTWNNREGFSIQPTKGTLHASEVMRIEVTVISTKDVTRKDTVNIRAARTHPDNILGLEKVWKKAEIQDRIQRKISLILPRRTGRARPAKRTTCRRRSESVKPEKQYKPTESLNQPVSIINDHTTQVKVGVDSETVQKKVTAASSVVGPPTLNQTLGTLTEAVAEFADILNGLRLLNEKMTQPSGGLEVLREDLLCLVEVTNIREKQLQSLKAKQELVQMNMDVLKENEKTQVFEAQQEVRKLEQEVKELENMIQSKQCEMLSLEKCKLRNEANLYYNNLQQDVLNTGQFFKKKQEAQEGQPSVKSHDQQNTSFLSSYYKQEAQPTVKSHDQQNTSFLSSYYKQEAQPTVKSHDQQNTSFLSSYYKQEGQPTVKSHDQQNTSFLSSYYKQEAQPTEIHIPSDEVKCSNLQALPSDKKPGEICMDMTGSETVFESDKHSKHKKKSVYKNMMTNFVVNGEALEKNLSHLGYVQAAVIVIIFTLATIFVIFAVKSGTWSGGF